MYAEVLNVERLSPSMVRVVFAGGELDQFTPAAETDAYINARFVPAGSPVSVPFESDELDDVEPELRPRPRRYTVRDWDASNQTLTVDFVAHGDQGYAGPWAQRAEPGDRLQFVGPRGNYLPSPAVDWHLFVGDESALPAIGASLESLSGDAVAQVFVVVDGPEHQYPLPSDASVEVLWLYRDGAADPEALLVEALTAADFPEGSFDAFVHGEAGEVRDVRRYLEAERNVDVGAQSISPYWRRNHTDEAWREVKRDFMSQ